MQRYLADNFAHMQLEDAELARLYRAILERRRIAKQDAKLAAEIAAMTNRELLQAVRSCDRNVGRSQERGTKSYRFWLVRRGRLMAEIRRRRPDLDRDDKQAVLLFAEHVKAERKRHAGIKAKVATMQQPLVIGEPSAGCVSSNEPMGRSERDELHASIVRDLLSWGKVSKALDQAELIADATYRAAVVRDIHMVQQGGATP